MVLFSTISCKPFQRQTWLAHPCTTRLYKKKGFPCRILHRLSSCRSIMSCRAFFSFFLSIFNEGKKESYWFSDLWNMALQNTLALSKYGLTKDHREQKRNIHKNLSSRPGDLQSNQRHQEGLPVVGSERGSWRRVPCRGCTCPAPPRPPRRRRCTRSQRWRRRSGRGRRTPSLSPTGPQTRSTAGRGCIPNLTPGTEKVIEKSDQQNLYFSTWWKSRGGNKLV